MGLGLCRVGEEDKRWGGTELDIRGPGERRRGEEGKRQSEKQGESNRPDMNRCERSPSPPRLMSSPYAQHPASMSIPSWPIPANVSIQTPASTVVHNTTPPPIISGPTRQIPAGRAGRPTHHAECTNLDRYYWCARWLRSSQSCPNGRGDRGKGKREDKRDTSDDNCPKDKRWAASSNTLITGRS